MELRRVKPLPGGKKRRDLYLDLKQRRALLKAATGAARDLIEAAILTGARAGELVKATRSQFDSRTKSMTFKGKTGTRTVPISADAVTLFTRLAEGKSADDRLFYEMTVRRGRTPIGTSLCARRRRLRNCRPNLERVYASTRCAMRSSPKR
jgi:integrase